jgi:CheY-like chemotaxis protein
MAEKCALIVDDSRLARTMLSKMLKRYDIHVDTAKSAEESLDFLHHKRPDVIFMDHLMPGMDGLAAVKIIKNDPKTATIPIIMYTTKEGEVYVGQARALGAIGILSKEVEPSELHRVLRSLNLVAERREKPRRDMRASLFQNSSLTPETVEQIAKIAAKSVHSELDLTRLGLMFETQHVKLREKMVGDVKAAVRDVFKQDRDVQKEPELTAEVSDTRVNNSGSRWRLGPVGITVLIASLLLPTYLLYKMHSELDGKLFKARAVIAELRSDLKNTQPGLAEDKHENKSGGPYGGTRWLNDLTLLETVEWSLNLNNHFAYDQIPFDDAQLERVRSLVSRLATSRFEGTVRLTPHFARFCLVRNTLGEWELAPNDLEIQSCELLGHPAQQTTGLADLQSLAFGSFLTSSQVLSEGKIRIDIAMPQGTDSTAFDAAPLLATNASEWNQIAQTNNRVEVALIPDGR